MTKIFALIKLTFLESFAKKTFLAFFGISTFIWLMILFALNLDIIDGVQSGISLFGQETGEIIQLEKLIFGMEAGLAILLFTGGLFMSLFATSSLIPSMLQKGNCDLLISKSLTRRQIMAGRYLGAVSIVAFNVAYLVVFSWLVLSLKSGVWNFGFLLSGVMIILAFAILYAFMALTGLTTGSSAFSLMLTYMILFFSPLLLQRDKIYALLSDKIYGQIVDGIYYALPKTTELGNITQQLVRGVPVESWMPLWSSLIFGTVVFAITTFIFERKNF